MRAAYFIIIASLFCLLPAFSATALQPMDDLALDSVQAQSGIAIGIDNVQVYSHTGFSYEATSGGENRKIQFEDMASFLILNTRNPLTFRVIQNYDEVAMMEFAGQPSIYLQSDVNQFAFAGQDLGSLHIRLRPPTDDLMGFMEEFFLLVAPLGTQEGTDGDGIAFHLEMRTGIDEFRWDYNKEDDDEFWYKGIYMAREFDSATEMQLHGPEYWNPTGRFAVGNLNPYSDDNPMGPATFQVVPDPDAPEGEGYAMMRFNLPMQGSLRIHEVGMFSYGEIDQDPQAAPEWPLQPSDNPVDVGYRPDDFGPIIIDNMRFDHLQVDFKTYIEPPPDP